MGCIFLYTGAVLTIVWGIAHLFPTKSVVRGFGDISIDNKRILTMEWIIEGATMIFLGVLVAVVTITDPLTAISNIVYLTVAIFLVVLAIISLFTGYRVNFFPYKMCPVIFTVSAILIIVGGYIS
jgi:hypothetical protein